MESRNYYFFKGNPIIFPAFLFHRSFFSLSVSPPYLETRFSFCHNDRVAKTIVSRAHKHTHSQTNKQTNTQTNKHTNKQTNKQTNNVANKQTPAPDQSGGQQGSKRGRNRRGKHLRPSRSHAWSVWCQRVFGFGYILIWKIKYQDLYQR